MQRTTAEFTHLSSIARWAALALLLLTLSPVGYARSTATDFPADAPWLNVSEKLSMEQLKGKVVLLDFWTYGCVNCMHVLPDLARLEEQFGHALAVISVHSPKFENEKNTERLRQIVARYEIKHAVVNDVDFKLWRAYQVNAWPTFVLIDTNGQYVGQLSGEGQYETLQQAIKLLLEEADDIDRKPLPIALETLPESRFAAPGKAVSNGDYIAVADTLHHQIVVTDKHGKTVQRIGTGNAAFNDGSASAASFNSPQGLAFAEQTLYVADTGNHALRAIDLSSWQVTTVAGTGQLGRNYNASGKATAVALRSPWDITMYQDDVIIAMAGTHQIWRYSPSQQRLSILAGSGREALLDGTAKQAAFNQPSGLAVVGDTLYVADAEASAIRAIDLTTQKVRTVVGQGLFEFGSKDGDFARALLQHPLAVAALTPDQLVVADTYNHQLRLLDLGTQQVSTLHLSDSLLEPGGVSIIRTNEQNQLLIADTGHQRILIAKPSADGWQLQPLPDDDADD
ncbi:thioredoxin-like domain-containing protein [Idiomarina xiamenensis]|uniref:NHL repeat containing protein n=1 Tax=Idiomarina xiamenensis 10-D-4 TaxID=740709 RepID=K2LCJ0_9GAMM|nr:thioredoxin-like domain-containing protein [Idiomarina xiamenensis]EKE87600.1 NHL repeat containing protein [Idiomarina xiamenensis 10-D-4]